MQDRETFTRVTDPEGETRSLATDAATTFVLTTAGGAGTTVGIGIGKELLKTIGGTKPSAPDKKPD